MSIMSESVEMNGREFVRTYSDIGLYIERDGVEYAEAVDPVDSGRVYVETTREIEAKETPGE